MLDVYNDNINNYKNVNLKNKVNNLSIGFLSNVFFPVSNGVVHSLHLLAKGLKSLGFDPFLITSKHPNFNQDIIQKYNIDYEVISIPSIYFKKIDYCIPNPLNVFFISKFIANKKIDILQLNHPFLIYNISKKIKKQNNNIKKVFVFHTQYDIYHNYVKFIPLNLYTKFIWNHINEVILNVDAVVVPSNSMINKIKNNIDSKFFNKLNYIPNPVDFDFINKVDLNEVKSLRDKFNLKDKFVLGFVGRIEKEKNLDTLLEFFVKNFKDNNDVVLLIVGGGSILQQLKNKYSNFKNIIFTGKIEYSKIGLYYKLLDVFISLSLSEVKPLAYLEALSMGVPIISFKTIGADDLITNNYNGFLIDFNKNYELDLLQVIKILISNKDLLVNIKLNAINTSKEYHYIKITQKYLELYKNLLK
jgi:glycosyltransferase involved in cell wall biosynthesis